MTITAVSSLLNCASLRVSGVSSVSALCTSVEIWPSSVLLPVAMTRPAACPAVTSVPEYARLWRSASAVAGGSGDVPFATGTDSPVSMDSSTRMSRTESRRKSAGTRSPASSNTTSPGTSNSASTRRAAPSRRTAAFTETSRLSASMAA
ncbi:MAG: hypothetical protein BWY76_00142 [bacterium ADurb.Bin429]|nr:MAG: hypothetical protein BWY76_00142 [bacterium ADurb.Bin429]